MNPDRPTNESMDALRNKLTQLLEQKEFILLFPNKDNSVNVLISGISLFNAADIMREYAAKWSNTGE